MIEPTWLDVTTTDALVDGARMVITLPCTPPATIVLARIGAEYHAFDQLCTHAAFSLADADIIDNEIICPWHGASFSLLSGQVLCPPAQQALKIYPVRVQHDTIQILYTPPVLRIKN